MGRPSKAWSILMRYCLPFACHPPIFDGFNPGGSPQPADWACAASQYWDLAWLVNDEDSLERLNCFLRHHGCAEIVGNDRDLLLRDEDDAPHGSSDPAVDQALGFSENVAQGVTSSSPTEPAQAGIIFAAADFPAFPPGTFQERPITPASNSLALTPASENVTLDGASSSPRRAPATDTPPMTRQGSSELTSEATGNPLAGVRSVSEQTRSVLHRPTTYASVAARSLSVPRVRQGDGSQTTEESV